jgi:CMP-N-acetylneuraminic acid synthetase|tara:strand:- start:462 stop:1076 length:615 start_codon:yes stop_codon:yes gene_type:complete
MKLINISALAIIPAKTDSTRLKKKNLRVIAGKTLVEHAIDYAKNSELIKYIVVTSESDEVWNITKKYDDIIFYDRDESYMGEREVADVYVNVVQNDILQDYDNQGIVDEISHVVGIQPDHPDRRTNVDELLTYAVKNKYDDLVTVDSNGTRNGAVRITKKEFVESGMMSRRVGSYLDDCTNIHSEEDLRQAERHIEFKTIRSER